MSTKKAVRKTFKGKGRKSEGVGIPGIPGGLPRGDLVGAPQEWFPRTTPLTHRSSQWFSRLWTRGQSRSERDGGLGFG